MLTSLTIQNLVLVDRAEVAFGPGLNIITGETGAGKSALLSAIRLIAGERADVQLIGKRGEFAVVEAVVSGVRAPEEIEAAGECLSIRREIHRSGKNRIFVDDQQVSLVVLKQMMAQMLEIIDQSSSRRLCELDFQRDLLDCFAETSGLAREVQEALSGAKVLEKKREELIQSREGRERLLEFARADLELIEEVHWQEGEEERLSEEHTRLTFAQEIGSKGSVVLEILEALRLGQAVSLMEACVKFDPALGPVGASLKAALVEIEEAERSLISYLDRLDARPERLNALEERIGAIEKVKKRFGSTVQEVAFKKQELLAKIDTLSDLDEKIVDLERDIAERAKEIHEMKQRLCHQRRLGANAMVPEVMQQVQRLNLPHAQFAISVGEEAVRFLFSANVGQTPLFVEECASGGELSRLLLALKSVVADKDQIRCLISDEGDGNVGGKSALALGEWLKRMGKGKQVICVTHFAQVARFADLHFGVTKDDMQDSSVTKVAQLSEKEREKEYLRMQGVAG